MERLTVRDDEGRVALVCREGCRGGPACFFCEQRAVDRLAAYEDTGLEPERVAELAKAEQDGRLVVLPCKVGDTVYVTYGEGYRLHVVDRIYVAGNQKVQVRMRNPCTMSETLRLDASNFGKTVFLTEEEAEAALERMKGARDKNPRPVHDRAGAGL